MKVELEQRVKVANKNQINYPKRGTVIAQTTEPGGLKMSKVKFHLAECWYADNDLKPVKLTKAEREEALAYQEIIESRGMRIVRLKCPECKTRFRQNIDLMTNGFISCGNVMCDKAVHTKHHVFRKSESEVESDES